MARCLRGPKGNALEVLAETYLGVTLDKTLQTSDWSAAHLILGQVQYAAVDAVVTWHLPHKLLPLLGAVRPVQWTSAGSIPALAIGDVYGLILSALERAGKSFET